MTAVAVPGFTLPRSLEATEPPELRGSGRDDVKMLVSRGDSVEHVHFRDLPRYLSPGDLLVVNRSATVPAALTARRADGETFALHLSTRLPGGLHVVEPRRTRVERGEEAELPAGGLVSFLWPYHGSNRLWIAALTLPLELGAYLRAFGRPIRYDYMERQYPIEMYQTMFASVEGSAEMPSAGRPFTPEMVAAVKRQGAEIASILLHTGVASLETGEPPYEEWFEVDRDAVEAVRRSRERGGRIVAVGTTVVRALESSLGRDGEPVASRGWTDLVLDGSRPPRLVDSLLTGLHEPRATHLAMLEAFLSPDLLAWAYDEARQHRYLWHEFGDLHLILR